MHYSTLACFLYLSLKPFLIFYHAYMSFSNYILLCILILSYGLWSRQASFICARKNIEFFLLPLLLWSRIQSFYIQNVENTQILASFPLYFFFCYYFGYTASKTRHIIFAVFLLDYYGKGHHRKTVKKQ